MSRTAPDPIDDDGRPLTQTVEPEPECCPHCGAQPAAIGQQGRTLVLRCRACGWTWVERFPEEGRPWPTL